MSRNLVLALSSVLIGLAAVLLTLDITLRFLPVSSGTQAVAVSGSDPIFRFTPNRTLTYSQGWRFENANRVRVNNAGFMNLADYETDSNLPLLAVIGDSYVEGLVVPQTETLQYRLAAAAAPRGRVYSFAASGAPLSQYLAWAQYASDKYRAKGAVFLVVGNDFDESLASVKRGPGFHHFFEMAGKLELHLVPYRPNPLRGLVYHTALGRYAVFNLKVLELPRLIHRVWSDFTAAGSLPVSYAGNTAAAASARRLASSRRTVDFFLDQLSIRTHWPPGRVMFLLDGVRAYEGGGLTRDRTSYFARMREYLRQAAVSRGYSVIDMHGIFDAHFREHGERFEFEKDSHWNALAHGLAAGAVRGSVFFRHFFGR